MRTRLTILGALWGFLAGLVACAAVLPALAFFLVFFVIGEGSTPPPRTTLANWSAILVAVGVLVAATVLGGVRGFLRSGALEGKGRLPSAQRVTVLFAGTLAVYLGLGFLVAHYLRGERRDRAATARGEEAYCALANSLHRVTATRCGARPDGSGFDVLIDTRGTRTGAYKISLLVSENLYNFRMFSTSSLHNLRQPVEQTTLFVPYRTLVDTYRHNVFEDRPVDVSGDASLDVVVTLKPVLTPEERAALPPHTPSCRAANGSVQFLELESVGETKLPFSFRLRSGASQS